MGTYTPYSPMGRADKVVTEDRMCEILAKHTGQPVSLPPASSTKKRLPLKIKSEAAKELEQETWLIHRLGTHGEAVDRGVTDRDIRRERMREAIQAVGPMVIVGRDKAGDSLTYAQAFTRLYGVAF